jgi:co-chaperonin GroES (HSP10)
MTPLKADAMTVLEATYDEKTFFDHVKAIADRYDIQPIGYQLLVAMWIRPRGSKTSGGLFLPDKTLDEDKWQGKIGQVIALGPCAYASDQYRVFNGPWCEPEDWVVVPKSEHVSRLLEVEGMHFCFLNDDRILGRIGAPIVA